MKLKNEKCHNCCDKIDDCINIGRLWKHIEID